MWVVLSLLYFFSWLERGGTWLKKMMSHLFVLDWHLFQLHWNKQLETRQSESFSPAWWSHTHTDHLSFVFLKIHLSFYFFSHRSSCSASRFLGATFSRSVQALARALASTSLCWWWNPFWWHCCLSTLFVLTRARPWTASHKPTTFPSSL